MIYMPTGCRKPCKEINIMHDLLIALAFVGMVVAPAIVAASNKMELPEKNK